MSETTTDKEPLEIMNINNIEYVKKEEYDKLVKLEINESKYMLTDPANVIGIMSVSKEKELDEDIIITNSWGRFKRFSDNVKFGVNKNLKPETFFLGNSKYSYEYLQKAIKTAKAFGLNYTPEFFLHLKEEATEDDFPCLIKFDRLIFMLASRVGDKDGS